MNATIPGKSNAKAPRSFADMMRDVRAAWCALAGILPAGHTTCSVLAVMASQPKMRRTPRTSGFVNAGAVRALVGPAAIAAIGLK